MKPFVLFALSMLVGITVYGQNHFLDNYLTNPVTVTTIATFADSVSGPRDLDFKPGSNELWVCNYGTSDGGTTVIVYNAGMPNQTSQFRKDSHSDHFMPFPSAIAFGDDGKFASVGEIQSTGGATSTFMGPTLWSNDTSIYATVFQNDWVGNLPLGSHLDMLHQSPFAMGIAHDSLLAYWVFDGHNGNICKYDYVQHHGPGYEDHSHGKIWRYTDVPVIRETGVPSHMILDKASRWLYFIDGGTKKLKRMDTQTGAVTGTLTTPSTGGEPLAGYYKVEGSTVEVLDSFVTQPCGIDFYKNRLIVSDFNTGDIHLYDTDNGFTHLGIISSGQSGVMGIKIGPDGRIWFVNNTQNTICRLDAQLSSTDVAATGIISPVVENYKSDYYSSHFNDCDGYLTPSVQLSNNGSSVVTEITVNYSIDGGIPSAYSWTGSLAPAANIILTLPSSTVLNGPHEIEVNVVSVNNAPDDIDINNNLSGAFRVIGPSVTLPFYEDFSSTTVPPVNWNYVHFNPNNKINYSTSGGSGLSTGSIRMDNYSGYEVITGQIDYLILPVLDLSTTSHDTYLSFEVAYAKRSSNSADQLQVMASVDCGNTWNVIYDKSGTALSTAPNTSSSFTPLAGYWRTDSVNLDIYLGTSEFALMFAFTSDHGNHVYIDDVNIRSLSVDIASLENPKRVFVFPNPAISEAGILSETKDYDRTGKIYNVNGEEIFLFRIPAGTDKCTVDVSEYTSGVYFIEITDGKIVYRNKLIKN
jgi:hypothetical protein